jgi:GNAT superfamily N-acetyltransferase
MSTTPEGETREAAMPSRSQHFPLPAEEWERLSRPPGWKYEYFDGCVHISPGYQFAVTTVEVGPRPINTSCPLRPVRTEDEEPLLALYLEAFENDPVYCDYTDEQFRQAAANDLRESFVGRRAPLLAASRVAETADSESTVVGAALVSREPEYGPVLDLLFIRPRWQRRGVATALVASTLNGLDQAGERTLTSCYHLANVASQAWHRVFGFLERPDLRNAEVYARYSWHELSRREAAGELAAAERAELKATAAYWQNQVTALEHLENEHGFRAVHPRIPHW